MRKTISLSAVLMIALSITGITYALWSKTLSITAQVNTDTVDAEWIGGYSYDPPSPPTNDLVYNGLTWTSGTKNVGWTNVSGLLTDTLVITVNNSYPCYFVDIETEYINNGSIPVKIQNITVTPTGSWKLASTWNATDGPVWVSPGNGIGSQLDPYSWNPSLNYKSQSFKLHVTQNATQGATYMFTVQVLLVQWNEYHP
jgi:hypothetical protein